MLFLEELLDGKSGWKFGILYTVMLLMNYYITFMITVFIAISYFIWILSVKDKKYIFNRTKVLAITGITSFLLGSISIIPSYLCQKMVKDQATLQINLHRIYHIKDLFNNLFFNIDSAKGQIIGNSGIAFNHYPHVYMSFVITFILVSFFFSKLINKKRRFLQEYCWEYCSYLHGIKHFILYGMGSQLHMDIHSAEHLLLISYW